MLYVPRHLPNKLEYKVLSCISVHYQSRMTSNEIAITPSRLHSAGRAIWGIGAILVQYLGMLWVLLLGDLRSIHRGGVWMAASRCVRCMQSLCWGFVLGRHGQFGESLHALCTHGTIRQTVHVYTMGWCCVFVTMLPEAI